MSTTLTLGVDIDGVLADYTAAVRLAAHRLGNPIDGTRQPTVFGMVEDGWFTSREDWARAHEIVTGELEDMAPIDPGAATHLNGLRADGHRIVFLTARHAPAWQDRYDDRAVLRGTERWLDTWGFEVDELRLDQTKTGHGLDVLVDDAPHNIEAYQAAGESCVIYDAAYNRHLAGPRVTSIEHFARHVRYLTGHR